MLDWIKSMVAPPQPAGPAQPLRVFGPADAIINQDAVTLEDDSLVVEVAEESSVRLFEVHEPEVDNCILTYRAELKTEDASGRVFLAMWCRFPGRGEFFSKGLDNAVKGTNDWASYETPFFLKSGQTPDLIKLNLTSEGQSKVWLRNIELLYTPLETRASSEAPKDAEDAGDES